MKAQIFIDSVVLWQAADTILQCSQQQEEHSEANQRIDWAMPSKRIYYYYYYLKENYLFSDIS